jgi:hypothetical protein
VSRASVEPAPDLRDPAHAAEFQNLRAGSERGDRVRRVRS